MIDSIKIRKVKVNELLPYARNSRTHSDAQVAQIAASITEFGWTNPILADGDKGIIAGHGRLLAARKLGMDTVPVIELSHLTKAQKQAYIIADNKLALNADWDYALLKIELDDLKLLEFDINLTGIDPTDEVYNIDNNQLDDEKYSTKITTPIYEIKGDKPLVSELYNNNKTNDLSNKIINSDIPEEIKTFLINASYRHIVFNYQNIAEFYAHSDEGVKSLMRQSALVIIDYDQAIEEGYVELSKELMNLSEDD